jgi:hypothetical protein
MRFFLLLLSLIFLKQLKAQRLPEEKRFSVKAQQVFVEALGPGLLYSINYDQRLFKKETGLGIRIGASRYKGDDGRNRSTVPVQLNYLIGAPGRYFEIGAGTTYGGGNDIDNPGTGNFIGTATVGYRRQPYQTKGLTWRLALTPLFIFEPQKVRVLPWAGCSIGFRF